jgi:hypothetical protein
MLWWAMSQARRSGAVFALLLGVYLATSSFRIDTIDSVVRLEVARNLVSRHAFDLPPLHLVTQYGVVGAFTGVDGRAFSIYGMGQSLLMAPLVWLGGEHDAQLVMLINPIATALACALLLPIVLALGASVRAATMTALVAGLGTLCWPQAKLAFEAPLEMLCLVLAIFFLQRARRVDLYLAGAAIGFAFLTRPTAIMMVPGLAWWIVRRPVARRRWLELTLGAAPVLALALWYNALRWGGPFASGYPLTEHTYFQALPVGLPGLLLSPGRGFFWFSPILVLAPWGWARLRDRGLAVAIAIIAGSYLLLQAFSTVWHGDWTWGPRHLLPLVPLGAILIAPFLEPEALEPAVRRGLIAISVGVQVVGVYLSYDVFFVRTRPQDPSAVIDHFDPATAQIPIELGLAWESFWILVRQPDPIYDTHVDPYPCRIEDGSPPQAVMAPAPWPLPALWWFYMRLAGASLGARLLLLALCGGLIGGGARALRHKAV